MPKDRKGRKFYEVTREKPSPAFEAVLGCGAIGAVVGFFFTLVAGAVLGGVTLDGMMLLSLVSCVLGFGLGAVSGALLLRYFGTLLNPSAAAAPRGAAEPPPGPGASGTAAGTPAAAVPGAAGGAEAGTAPEEKKGSSVDYVFPEFSPDQS